MSQVDEVVFCNSGNISFKYGDIVRKKSPNKFFQLANRNQNLVEAALLTILIGSLLQGAPGVEGCKLEFCAAAGREHICRHAGRILPKKAKAPKLIGVRSIGRRPLLLTQSQAHSSGEEEARSAL